MANVSRKSVKKVTMNLSEELLERIEAYADTINVNRTSAMSVLMSEALDQKAALNAVNDLMPLITRLEKLFVSSGQLKQTT